MPICWDARLAVEEQYVFFKPEVREQVENTCNQILVLINFSESKPTVAIEGGRNKLRFFFQTAVCGYTVWKISYKNESWAVWGAMILWPVHRWCR